MIFSLVFLISSVHHSQCITILNWFVRDNAHTLNAIPLTIFYFISVIWWISSSSNASLSSNTLADLFQFFSILSDLKCYRRHLFKLYKSQRRSQKRAVKKKHFFQITKYIFSNCKMHFFSFWPFLLHWCITFSFYFFSNWMI